MISLSNVYQTHQNTQEKVIEIQPIDQIKEKPTQKELTQEEQLVTIEQKIEYQKTELNRLKDLQSKRLAETKALIQQEKEQWENEKQLLIDKANQHGYEVGFAKGESESLKQYSDHIAQANNLIETATKDYYRKIEQSKDMIIELAIHTAEKILNEHLTKKPEAFLPIVETAINTIKNGKTITIYVHPNKYHFLMKQKEELMNSVDGRAELKLYIDQDLQETDCLIEHPFGQVDASIDTQLEQIHTVLQNVNNDE